MIVPLSLLFLKKNSNLATMPQFTLCYQRQISEQFFIAYSFSWIFRKKSKMLKNWLQTQRKTSCANIGRFQKITVAENSLPLQKIINLTKLSYSIYISILLKTKWITFTITVATNTSFLSGMTFLFYTHSHSSKKKKLEKNLFCLSLYYLLVIKSFHFIFQSVLFLFPFSKNPKLSRYSYIKYKSNSRNYIITNSFISLQYLVMLRNLLLLFFKNAGEEVQFQ